MGHKVRFEPVGIDIEVEEDETILTAAFRHGLLLMHGCKEGQCSACKSFLLDGDLDMERYSTFALADYEREEGYVLLCRSHAYSDLEIELINYDEEVLRSGVAIKDFETTIRSLEWMTPDIRRLILEVNGPEPLRFSAGQYVDITIPGTTQSRSFSMASTPTTPDRLEFLIRVYPGGRFSSLLADGGLGPGDHLALNGPYGVCTLRPSSKRDLILVGGGAGMAPLLSILRTLAESRSERRVTFYYGARGRRDLFYLDEIASLGAALPSFRFVPVLSEPVEGESWDGERGLVTDTVEREEQDLSEKEAYLCGPPPMIDAAMVVLRNKGMDDAFVHFDKFTVSAEAEATTH